MEQHRNTRDDWKKELSRNNDEQERKQRDQLHRVMVDRALVPSCLNCEHYRGERGCTQAPGQPIPDAVLVFGCPLWLMEIPF